MHDGTHGQAEYGVRNSMIIVHRSDPLERAEAITIDQLKSMSIVAYDGYYRVRIFADGKIVDVGCLEDEEAAEKAMIRIARSYEGRDGVTIAVTIERDRVLPDIVDCAKGKDRVDYYDSVYGEGGDKK